MRALLWPGIALLAVATVAGCASNNAPSTKSTGSAGASVTALQEQYEGVVRTVLPSVVQINTSDGGTGSGVVYDNKGDIVTNEHVVSGNRTVQVRDSAGNKTLTADVIGTFPPDDLAVIRVTSDASGLKPATFGNSDDLQVGQIVLAMGNPLGLTDSVSQGIISATGRTVGEGGSSGALITAAIQTSAAINPGNSGGALVDLSDQVIGIPTLAAKLPGETGGLASGIGFAIPVNTVKDIAGQLIAHGKVTDSGRGSLGITAQTSANGSGEPEGVAVVDVTPSGTAAKAGVAPGDLIVGINGTRVLTVQELETLLATIKPGTDVTIHFTANGASKTGTAPLGTLTS